jgi:hypothetical protein
MMKKSILISVMIWFAFLSVNGQSADMDSWKLNVPNPSEYDSQFLKYWEYLKPHPVTIFMDSIIVNNARDYPVIIPTDLPLNEEIIYECIQDKIKYTLKVKRINYTNVEFSIIGLRKKKVVFERKGVSILEPSFHLGAAGVYEKDDEVYKMNNYNVTVGKSEKQEFLIPVGTVNVIDYIENMNSNELVLSFRIMK